MGEIGVLVAFLAGLASFLSPCVLPLVPTYLSYLAGASLDDLVAGDLSRLRPKMLGNSIAFILGFALVFMAFGAGASAVGSFLQQHSEVVRRVSAVLIIFMGLSLMGVIRLGFMVREHRFEGGGAAGRGGNPIRSLLLGMAFSAGWSPCVGPILASILALAGTSGGLGQGVLLLGVYSFGLAIPFFLAALSIASFQSLFRRFRGCLGYVNLASGLLMVVVGLLMYFNYFIHVSSYVFWG